MEKQYEMKIRSLRRLSKKVTQNLPYHNFNHEEDVSRVANNLGIYLGLSYEERALLRTAAIIHDIIVIPGQKDNEERSIQYVKPYMGRLGYSPEEQECIYGLVLATKMPQKPKTLLEQILCDADLDNLGREDFLKQGDKVRQELKIPAGKGWYEGSLKLIQSHTYHTEAARKLRDAGKKENIKKLNELLAQKVSYS